MRIEEITPMTPGNKKVYILIGLPATGKTTFRKSIMEKEPGQNWVAVSIDDIIERAASEASITFDAMFYKFSRAATRQATLAARDAYENGRSVVWDATNPTKKIRAEKIRKIPEGYRIYAFVFPEPPKEEHRARLAALPATISGKILRCMRFRYEPPSMDEGFIAIFT
jgi:predicted kinase